jgi:hypothetical protein
VKLSELIDRLQEIAETCGEGGPDPDVMLATQPHWPLAYHVAGVCDGADIPDAPDADPARARDRLVVWIVEGDQDRHHPYAPSEAWEASQ